MELPRIGVVGAGRVGAVLAAKFIDAGYDAVAVSGNSDASHLRITTLLPGVDVTEPADVVRRSDLVFLCVPDDALSGVAEQLAPVVTPGQIVAHTSGRHGLAVLEPLERAGARPLAFHPAMTFTGAAHDLDRTCVFGLTARDDLRETAERLVADLGGRPEWIAENDRVLYHAALAHGANHLVTLVSQAMGLLRDAGIAEPDAVLRPLLDAAVDNTLQFELAALTGPVVRGDVSTVESHVEALAETDPTTRETYLALARATASAAEADGRLTEPAAGAIRRTVSDHTEFDRGAAGSGASTRGRR